MRKKPQLCPEGLALILSLAAHRFALVCPVCQQAVTNIQPRGRGFVWVPCGHPLQTAPTDE